VTQKPKYDAWKDAAINGTGKRTVLPIRFATEQDDHANLPRQEAIDYSAALPVDSEIGRMNKPARADAHVSDKVYLFPESFNALRIELSENWPNLWYQVGYVMAFDSITFIECMDAALDTKTTFDSDKVSAICHKYLNLLRNKRGLSSLSHGSGEIK
jgi:hypothetical protein